MRANVIFLALALAAAASTLAHSSATDSQTGASRVALATVADPRGRPCRCPSDSEAFRRFLPLGHGTPCRQADGADEQLLQIGSESVVALNDAGRERYARIRTAIDQITAPLYGDLPPGDVAVTRRVLNTIADRADTLLARA